MGRTLRYGIIGCGMMGQEHIRNIKLLEGAEVSAMFEPDDAMRSEARALAPDATQVNSLSELLRLGDLDCLLIASPNYRHAEQLIEIAATNPLPLLVEKPLITDPDDILRIEALDSNYPAPIWVAMEYRYMPPIAAFIDRVEASTGGIQMLSIREHRFPFLPKVGDWNRFNHMTGGTMVEKCCHFFDLMRLILKAEPNRVMASIGQNVNHLDEIYDGQIPDIADNGYVIVDFNNGSRAMLELCMFAEGSRFQEEIVATGPIGKIEVRVPGPGRFWPDHLGPTPVPQLELSPRDPQGTEIVEIPVDPALLAAGDHNGATFYQHQRFAAMVRGELSSPEVSLQDGMSAVKLGIAAQESSASGTVVEL